jgi:prepilin-type N-terminal cleavage/methylation domain-containing protein
MTRVEDRGQRSEVREGGDAPRRQHNLALRHRIADLRHPTSGLTLIELLITITILATLAALFLGASSAATEAARKARTKSTIHKIHTLLMERWASYTTRRVDINQNLIDYIQTSAGSDAKLRGEAMADLRLLALRELMKLEMPDRWSDVDLDVEPLGSGSGPLVCLQSVPSIARAYYRNLLRAKNATDIDTLERNGSAECLYLTVMLFTGDGEARTQFSRQDIGDTDGDGAPEFLDGWGNPIRWVRWPAGFIGRSDLMTRDPYNPLTGDADNDHDPFDPFRRNAQSAQLDLRVFPYNIRQYVRHLRGGANSYSPPTNADPTLNYQIGFRLVPLVFSMGPDGIGDISTRVGNIADGANSIYLDPYAWDPSALPSPGKYEFGSYGDNPDAADGKDDSIDNIHNHLLDNR